MFQTAPQYWTPPRPLGVHWSEDRFRVRLDPLPFPFALLLISGFLLGVEEQFNGTLFLGEILLAMFAVMGVALNLGSRRFWTWDLYWMLFLLGVSYAAYIFADIFSGNSTTNLLRGWARMGFLGTDILGLYVLCRKSRYNLFPVMLGLAISAFVMPHSTMKGDFSIQWKFDLAFSWISSACILFGFLSKRRAAIYATLCLIPVGVMSIALDSRLVGGACITVAVVLLAQLIASRRWRKLLIIFLAVAIAAGAVGTYSLLIHTDATYAERRTESNLARLTALLTALQRISQHPFMGTGSWNLSEEYLNLHRANTVYLGGKNVATAMALGHSQVLQAAVEAGIFGSTFFVYFLICLAQALWWVVKRPLDRFSAFAMFNLLMCIWHCLFSPQGGSQRIEIATGACICLLMASERRRLRKRGVNI
jgi:O-antigen ligase